MDEGFSKDSLLIKVSKFHFPPNIKEKLVSAPCWTPSTLTQIRLQLFFLFENFMLFSPDSVKYIQHTVSRKYGFNDKCIKASLAVAPEQSYISFF